MANRCNYKSCNHCKSDHPIDVSKCLGADNCTADNCECENFTPTGPNNC